MAGPRIDCQIGLVPKLILFPQLQVASQEVGTLERWTRLSRPGVSHLYGSFRGIGWLMTVAERRSQVRRNWREILFRVSGDVSTQHITMDKLLSSGFAIKTKCTLSPRNGCYERIAIRVMVAGFTWLLDTIPLLPLLPQEVETHTLCTFVANLPTLLGQQSWPPPPSTKSECNICEKSTNVASLVRYE